MNLIKANYWHQFESGFLSRTALSELVEAASAAQDDEFRCLDEWSHLQHHCRIPAALLSMHRLPFVGVIAKRLVLGHMEFAMDVAAGFVQAHLKVEKHFKMLVSHRAAAECVLRESRDQLRRARHMLEALWTSFPEIARSIVTRQAIHALLKNSQHLAHELLTHGEIEKKEYDVIQDSITQSIKRLVTRPPRTRIQDHREMLHEVRRVR